jgi:hypothetical protein
MARCVSPLAPTIRSTFDSTFLRRIVLTKPHIIMFNAVKAFVLGNQQAPSAQYRSAFLSMPNNFSAREHVFIGTLADDLHLTVTREEFDDNDQNIVTWRFPGTLGQTLPELDEAHKVNGDTEGSGKILTTMRTTMRKARPLSTGC